MTSSCPALHSLHSCRPSFQSPFPSNIQTPPSCTRGRPARERCSAAECRSRPLSAYGCRRERVTPLNGTRAERGKVHLGADWARWPGPWIIRLPHTLPAMTRPHSSHKPQRMHALLPPSPANHQHSPLRVSQCIPRRTTLSDEHVYL